MKLSFHSILKMGKDLSGNSFTRIHSLATQFLGVLGPDKLKAPHFMLISLLFLLLFLGMHNYLQGYVYVVYVEDWEVGTVRNEGALISYLDEITEKCANIHGMEVKPKESITITREYRPEDRPEPGKVEERIRRYITFNTEAFVVTVDDVPLAAVASENDLEKLQNELKNIFAGINNCDGELSSKKRLIDAFINEELGIEKCLIDPREILEAEELAKKMAAKKLEEGQNQELAVVASPENDNRFVLGGRYSGRYEEHGLLSSGNLAGANPSHGSILDAVENAEINVTIVEEIIVVEKIPFEVEKVEDDSMWIVDNEIQTKGEDGKKEIIYHVTRENGEEIKRTKVAENIIEEPVKQVELYGTAQVPAKGTGKFIWPIEDDGEVTPGRGFSSWHTGIDIDTSAGTNVLAADNGIVWFSGYGRTQGNYLIIYHGSYWTLYLHNEVNLVSEADKVDKGDIVARVGSTGRTTGAHLHFEVRRDDGTGEWLTYYQHEPVDPLRFFRP